MPDLPLYFDLLLDGFSNKEIAEKRLLPSLESHPISQQAMAKSGPSSRTFFVSTSRFKPQHNQKRSAGCLLPHPSNGTCSISAALRRVLSGRLSYLLVVVILE